ncbi:diguanylate cyclase [Anaerolinea thermophila]|uniref:GGDEF domain-containing protein n=1 Tax=Anaerolinea thermophila TaxID=167964 RepID=UPI0026F23C30|nr:sensor domain-containing diguanylate cyclase [Anaerolinea thermophila]
MSHFLSRIVRVPETGRDQRLLLPILLGSAGIAFFLFVYGYVEGTSITQRWINVLSGLALFAYFLIQNLFLKTDWHQNPLTGVGVFLFHVAFVLWFTLIEPYSIRWIQLAVATLFFINITILMGRWFAYAVLGMVIFLLSPLFPINVFPQIYITWDRPLSLILSATIINETFHWMKKRIEKQVERLEIINQMTRSLAFSIEPSQVTSLMSSAIQSALNADTYYIGFLENSHLRLVLLYDDGEFFEDQQVELENTFSGWVVINQRSLLVKDIDKEAARLGITLKSIGKPERSRSWMGTPLQTHEKLYGMVAVASYQVNAFNDSDLELLESFAQQAAISLENAFHHQEVETRSMQDSLTSALNHGAFLQKLTEECQKALRGGYPLSLIMLDIDHFKEYNDRYGHLAGDQVLIEITQYIQRYLKSTDWVGRWGGEEFAVILPNATILQAWGVARRIQKSLTRMELKDREGNPIPAPTISQGIACFPMEASEIYALIDLADQRLYQAKSRGRDQIETPLPVSEMDEEVQQ